MIFIIISLLTFYLAAASRLHGGGFYKNVPKWLRNTIWAAPFGIISYLLYADISTFLAVVCGLGAFALCFAGKAIGHGGFMDVGHNSEPRDPESVEFLIKPLHGRISEKAYDLIGLALVGMLSVLGGVIPLAIMSPLSGLILLAGGMLKSFSYDLGWNIYPRGEGPGIKDFNEATELGEAVSGLLVGWAYLVALSFL